MKICNMCGNKIDDNNNVCPICGNQNIINNQNVINNQNMMHTPSNFSNYQQQSPYQQQYYNQNIQNNNISQTNAKAKTGFISSIISLFIFPVIFGVIGIIFSLMGILEINDSKEQGKGYSIAGIVIGIFSCIYAFMMVSK